MESIINVIESISNKHVLGIVSEDKVLEAEQKLNLHFSEEFKAYTIKYASLRIKGYEFLGVVEHPALDVVTNTLELRSAFSDYPSDKYVVSSLYIDNIFILQDVSMAIYEYVPNSKLKKIFNNMAEYILSL